ncbi:hypothetical protein JG687_00015169 [Phytophthora cactorum]|uniref:Uncharacterized protein n=1 Tax=Phytophthora cactorum TaxID=29920 RepID=A0A8T1TXN4_9STRA|nr:hypothetical protein JG687_00015169 [Phytophthora cactorum]
MTLVCCLHVQINACVELVDAEKETFAVRITMCKLEHNHRLSEHSFRAHVWS